MYKRTLLTTIPAVFIQPLVICRQSNLRRILVKCPVLFDHNIHTARNGWSMGVAVQSMDAAQVGEDVDNCPRYNASFYLRYFFIECFECALWIIFLLQALVRILWKERPKFFFTQRCY